MNKIIVFYGSKGSGKDTCYGIIKKLSGRHIVHLSFAEKLRKSVWELFKDKIIDKHRIWGAIDEKEAPIEGWEIPSSLGYPEKYWTGRRLLQWFGTDICRTVYGQIWVNALIEQIHDKIPGPYDVCVTDCRFLNEYEALRNIKNTIFVNVIRNLNENGFSNHASEKDLPFFKEDIVINNNSTLEDLKKELEKHKKLWK